MPISRIETNSIAPSQTLTTPIIATTMGVGGATPSGSGSGITFPATQSASTDANTLDDYEEGTWTPTYSQGVTSPVYVSTSGFYKKVGNLVYVSGRIQLSSGTANASALIISGFPFAQLNGVGSQGAICIGYNAGFRTDGNITLLIAGGVQFAEFYKWDGTSFLGTNANSISATLHFSGCYHAA